MVTWQHDEPQPTSSNRSHTQCTVSKAQTFFIIVHPAEVMRSYFENSVTVNEQALALPVFPVGRSPEIFSSFNTLYNYLMEVGLYSLLDDL